MPVLQGRLLRCDGESTRSFVLAFVREGRAIIEALLRWQTTTKDYPAAAGRLGRKEFEGMLRAHPPIEVAPSSPTHTIASIIIVAHNGLDHTAQCLKSLISSTGDLEVEIIVVDNASVDGTRDLLRQMPGIITVFNGENRGFAAAVNQGILLAKGDYVVLLNPDTIVTQGWLTRLIKHAQDPSVGAVGPLTNERTGAQFDPESEASYGNIEEMHRYAQSLAIKNKGQSFEFNRVTGFCLLVTRLALDRVGPFDEQFIQGFYEDDDYCKRLIKAGHRILIARDVFVHHEGGSSFSTTIQGTANRQMMINRLRYLCKWSGGKWFTRMPKITVQQPAISVIMATKDRPHLLQHSVRSVMEQTFQNFELIVVNNGAQDLRPILRALGDDRIKYAESAGRGKCAALEVGLAATQGQYIAYLDDDDLYYPWHLETLLCALLNRPAYLFAYSDAVIADCAIVNNKHHVNSMYLARWDYDRVIFWEQNNVPPVAVMHHRCLLDVAGSYDESLPMYEDWDMFRRLSCFTDFLHVPIATAEWHRHVNILTRNEPPFSNRRGIKDETALYIRQKPLPAPTGKALYDLVNAGRHAERSGMLEVASAYYLEVLRRDPLHFEAILAAARVLKRLGREKRVRSILRDAHESRPDLPDGYLACAEDLLRGYPRQSEVLEAKELIEFAMAADPQHKTRYTWQLLSRCYRRLGLNKTARLCAQHSRHFSSSGPFRKFVVLWHREGPEVAIAAAMRVLRRSARLKGVDLGT